jgi:hypothetical protein
VKDTLPLLSVKFATCAIKIIDVMPEGAVYTAVATVVTFAVTVLNVLI